MIIYFIWYLIILGIGIVYMPLSMVLFAGWNDRGWIFSKSLGILTGAYCIWILNVAHIMRFRTGPCFLMLLLPAAAGLGIFLLYKRRHPGRNLTFREKRRLRSEGDAIEDFGQKPFPWRLIAGEELAFFLMMALWVYIIGFRPEAYGTEKFMDYGFVTAMLRGDYMPFKDPWYAGETVNYYYGGQYVTAWLIRLSQVRAGEGYNLMRALVAAMSFFLPFSLVSQMLTDRIGSGRLIRNRLFAMKSVAEEGSGGNGENSRDGIPTKPADGSFPESEAAEHVSAAALSGGIAAGCAVAFCGNFHYVVFGIIVPLIQKIKGSAEIYRYWFPESTRYIGYNPDTNDKTIHEFPSYSTVLGDLHAHYINILFVVLVTAVVYAWARRRVMEHEKEKFREQLLGSSRKRAEGRRIGQIPEILSEIFAPEILLIGGMTGLFRWTNFWDFPIYYVVCGSVIFFVNLRRYRKTPGRFWFIMLAEAAVMFAVGMIAARPFTSTFAQISSEIGMTHSHTPLYQLMILWWLPVTVSVWFIIARIRERVRAVKAGAGPETDAAGKEPLSTAAAGGGKSALAKGMAAFLDFFDFLPLPDLAALLFAACAMGLVWMPEVIYVKDIYIASHYRANTMFKLTYQAFILFGIVMGYVLVRAVALREKKNGTGRISYAAAIAGLAVLALTGGYIFRSVHDWFGNVLIAQNRISTDASVFISEDFPSDYGGVAWLNTHVAGQPVILEANGDSYSDYERVSVATGLPTVMGWYVHEWLWRNNTAAQNLRADDIKTIYTSNDEEMIRVLIDKYKIQYIYIGTLEREKFPDLNDDILQRLGEVAFSDGKTTYIMKVG